MLLIKFKNQQIEHEKTKTYTFQNFQFHFHYRVISKNVLIKIQKPQLCCCPDGLMVKLSVSQAVQNYTRGFESRLAAFSLCHLRGVLYSLILSMCPPIV